MRCVPLPAELDRNENDATDAAPSATRAAAIGPHCMSPLTFAIGDVHGCFDMLQSLLGACEAHSAGRPARYVFLGDYIDRGPDSRGVIQLLMRRQQAQPGTSVCLRGNHEQMAIRAHESALALSLWLQYGGAATRCNYSGS